MVLNAHKMALKRLFTAVFQANIENDNIQLKAVKKRPPFEVSINSTSFLELDCCDNFFSLNRFALFWFLFSLQFVLRFFFQFGFAHCLSDVFYFVCFESGLFFVCSTHQNIHDLFHKMQHSTEPENLFTKNSIDHLDTLGIHNAYRAYAYAPKNS